MSSSPSVGVPGRGSGEFTTTRVHTVLVVDDSAFMRRVISDILEGSREFRVVGTARNGLEALKQIHALEPDIVTLDVEMPELDGLQTLGYIMSETPRPVVMLSGAAGDGRHDPTIRALELGAVDFVRKPSGPISLDLTTVRSRLLEALRASTQVNLRGVEVLARPRAVGAEAAPMRGVVGDAATRVVVVATSTGGPRALAELVPALPRNLGAAVLIVQHMPAGFTASLAARLDGSAALAIREARTGDVLDPGALLVAPGGMHLRLSDDKRLRLADDAPEGGLRPRADFTIKDAVRLFGNRVLLVVLTGMGKDGLAGAQAVKRAGGRVLAEAESTCTVYGMPRAVAEAGLADEVLPLDQLAAAIAKELA